MVRLTTTEKHPKKMVGKCYRQNVLHFYLCRYVECKSEKSLFKKLSAEQPFIYVFLFYSLHFVWGFVANCDDMFCKNANKRSAKWFFFILVYWKMQRNKTFKDKIVVWKYKRDKELGDERRHNFQSSLESSLSLESNKELIKASYLTTTTTRSCLNLSTDCRWIFKSKTTN